MPDDEVEAQPTDGDEGDDVELDDGELDGALDDVSDVGLDDAAEGEDQEADLDEVDADEGADVLPPVAPISRDDLGGASSPTSSRVRLVLIVGAVLVVGLLIGRLTTGGDDGGGDPAADPDTGATGEAVPFPTGDQNRTGYWGFVQLTPIVIDTFDRADDPDSLGDAGEGGTWEPVAGTWGIRGDAAVTSGGSGEGPFLAVVPHEAEDNAGDGLTEVTMTVVEDGAGLVFRFLDASNYWSITANPGVGTWSVTRVIDGEAELVGELAGPTGDDTTLSVEQKGTSLRFMLDGVEYLAVTDGALATQLQGGIIASGSTTGQARWNRFLVLTYPADSAATTTTAPA